MMQKIRKIGNSKCVIIPQKLLQEIGSPAFVDISLTENGLSILPVAGKIIRRKPRNEDETEDLKKIAAIENLVDRKAYFMSLLTHEAEKRNSRPIVVGGSAVDFYTDGLFQSYDIDLVGSRKIIGEILERIFSFKPGGRHWINEQIGLFVEVPGMQLAGDIDKLTTIKVGSLKSICHRN